MKQPLDTYEADTSGPTTAGITLISISFSAGLLSLGILLVTVVLSAIVFFCTCGYGMIPGAFVVWAVVAVTVLCNAIGCVFAALGTLQAFKSAYPRIMPIKGLLCFLFNGSMIIAGLVLAYILVDFFRDIAEAS